MRFCDVHWLKLRMKLMEAGLGGYIAADRAEVRARLEAREFEPLAGAHMALVDQLVSVGGIGLMINRGCPLCLANREHHDGCLDPECTTAVYFDRWIDGAVQDQVADLERRQLAEAGGGRP